MTFSEKTARAIDKYTRRLVRRQPQWIRTLFETERIVFVVDDDGLLSLSVDESLPLDKKNLAALMIGRYIEKYPCDTIQITRIQ